MRRRAGHRLRQQCLDTGRWWGQPTARLTDCNVCETVSSKSDRLLEKNAGQERANCPAPQTCRMQRADCDLPVRECRDEQARRDQRSDQLAGDGGVADRKFMLDQGKRQRPALQNLMWALSCTSRVALMTGIMRASLGPIPQWLRAQRPASAEAACSVRTWAASRCLSCAQQRATLPGQGGTPGSRSTARRHRRRHGTDACSTR